MISYICSAKKATEAILFFALAMRIFCHFFALVMIIFVVLCSKPLLWKKNALVKFHAFEPLKRALIITKDEEKPSRKTTA